MHLIAPSLTRTYVTVPTGTRNYNLFNALNRPGVPLNVIVTVASDLGSSGSGVAFATGGPWAAGTVLTLINRARIMGFGGAGRSNPGGTAIAMNYELWIDNTEGYIYGGGGGGGTGASLNNIFSGGGGGGGQGDPGGGAGLGDSYQYPPRSDATAGSAQAPGSGGLGALGGFPFIYAGDGGGGGSFGQSGGGGSANSSNEAGGVGGVPGSAVQRNGYVLHWIGGYNSTRVKPYPVT